MTSSQWSLLRDFARRADRFLKKLPPPRADLAGEFSLLYCSFSAMASCSALQGEEAGSEEVEITGLAMSD
jgi:hypothetical protein